MSQHDLSIANQGFPAFRSDLNDALQALGSMQSGTAAPSTTYANMLWYDTTNNIVKMRNEDNDAWISLFTLDQSGDLVSAISAATGSFGALSATGNVTLGDSTSDTVTVNGATTFATQISAPNTFGFKNRILNGGMMIDQRNAGASISVPAGQSGYPVDRFYMENNLSGTVTAQRSTDAPAGFINSISHTVSTTDTPASGDYIFDSTSIEGLNMADLGWGTANAQTVTLSFWVKSSITGTYGIGLRNSAGNRSYVATYTVNASNTWEQKTVTIAGDTSGTWLTTNGLGVRIFWDLGSGSSFNGTANSWNAGSYWRTSGCVNWISNSGATFYITGVQLEKSSTATSFDYRPYGTELALCQRYAIQLAANGYDNYQYLGIGYLYNTTQGTYVIYLPVQMRATPTITQSGTLTASNLGINISSLAAPSSQIGAILTGDFTLVSGSTSGNAAFIRWANQSTKSLFLSAEL